MLHAKVRFRCLAVDEVTSGYKVGKKKNLIAAKSECVEECMKWYFKIVYVLCEIFFAVYLKLFLNETVFFA